MTEGVVVIGALKTRAEQLDALKIIEDRRWTAIADVTSGLRFLKHPLLDHSRDFSSLKPEKVLRLGGRLISKSLISWLEGVVIPDTCALQGDSKSIAQIISRTDWRGHALFLGNSLPIREMDTFAVPGEHIPLVAANRGGERYRRDYQHSLWLCSRRRSAAGLGFG